MKVYIPVCNVTKLIPQNFWHSSWPPEQWACAAVLESQVKRAQCNIPSLYVAVSLTFPTNSSHLCKLHIFNFFLFYICSQDLASHTDKKTKNSRTWLVCACLCTLSGYLWKTISTFTPSPLGASPFPLHFLKWSLWFLNCFTLILSCFPSRAVAFAYILWMAKPICFFLYFCQLKLPSALFSAWGLWSPLRPYLKLGIPQASVKWGST